MNNSYKQLVVFKNLKNDSIKTKRNQDCIKINPDIYKNNFLFSQISFKGLIKNNQEGLPLDTAFFRDYKTIDSALKTLKNNFPKGASILVYACSNGEEAISIYSLLSNDRNKYDITGIDVDEEAIELAKNNRYTLFPKNDDSYLLKSDPSYKEKLLQNIFFEIMSETEPPEYEINSGQMFRYKEVSDKQKYFKLNEDVKSRLTFKLGNINDISDLHTTQKIGAVFFRNALYHLIDDMWSKEKKTNDEKQKIIDDVVDKIYDKLETGGVFVLGNSSQEWKDCGVYLLNSLKRDGKFVPIYSSQTPPRIFTHESINVPTVWIKQEESK